MTEPWFDPAVYGWVPGALAGFMGAVAGTMAGVFASRGRYRWLVLGTFWAMLGCGVVLLAFSVAAWLQGQPYGVWYGLGLPGVILPLVSGGCLPGVYRTYQAAEQRKMMAQDLT